MLPSKFRLTVTGFNQNKNQGRKFQQSNLVLITKKSPKPLSRFVFVVPKSLDKRSSRRNQMKRILVEIIKKILPSIVGGFDALIKVKSKFQKEDRFKIQGEVLNLFRQASLLHGINNLTPNSSPIIGEGKGEVLL